MTNKQVAFISKVVCGPDIWKYDLENSQSAFLTTLGFFVTLTFDLLTSESKELIFVPDCT